MAGLNFSQYMFKLNDYLTKNGMEIAYQSVDRSQEEYERIFSEFFTICAGSLVIHGGEG